MCVASMAESSSFFRTCSLIGGRCFLFSLFAYLSIITTSPRPLLNKDEALHTAILGEVA